MRSVALVLLFLVCPVVARPEAAPYRRTGQAARVASAPQLRERLVSGAYGACEEIVFATRTISTDPHW